MRAEKSIYEEMVEKYGDEVPDSVRLLGRRRPTEAEFRYGKTLELRARELIAQHSTHGPQGVRDGANVEGPAEEQILSPPLS